MVKKTTNVAELMDLIKIIEDAQRSARFDEKEVFRNVNPKKIEAIVANQLLYLMDNKQTIQNFAGSLGRSIIGNTFNENLPSHHVNRNCVFCGLSIIRGLIREKVIRTKVEVIVKGKKENGDEIYHWMKIGEKWLKKTERNLYIIKKDAIVEAAGNVSMDFYDKAMPTIKKPRTRTSFFDNEAGPLVSNLNRNYVKRFSKKKCPKLYEQMNMLQSVKWSINTDVLEVYQHPKVKEHMKNVVNYQYQLPGGVFQQEGRAYDYDMTMMYANQFKDSSFYFYYFYDTRGRIYCSSSYLSPQGDKLAKSLLLFNNKKRIGEKGLYWIKSAVAVGYGEDKLSPDERVKLVDTRLEYFLATGNNPIDNLSRWINVEEPGPFLAACIELAKAYELDNPEDLISGLPISFDASCSGIQFMSYLTRDEITGALVNLTNQNERGDVYQYIADFIDWDNLEFWCDYKHLSRWLCKRPVMTIMYSAFPETLAKALKHDCEGKGIYPTEEQCLELAKIIFKTCGKKLPGPTKVMRLLKSMGKNLANKNKLIYAKGLHNDFPFIQSYHIPSTNTINWLEQGKKRYPITYIEEYSNKVDLDKIKTASSPNVIHFIDAQLASAVLSETEYDSATTHDAFYAVPSDCDNLYDEIRAQMFELYGTCDYLSELCELNNKKNTIKYGKLNTSHQLLNAHCFA